jgi:cell division septation protein DedD
MKSIARIAFAALLSTGGLALAQGAVVEAVQYPAWLERNGAAVPVTPGTQLQPQDQLRTGNNARLQLRMGEGSTVKLGENARFSIDKTEDRGIFRAALSVITGAFRFTTDAARKAQRRDVSIKVKNLSVGIRGTDVWGKSTDERDFVVLIEGRISVSSEGNPTVALDKPLDLYQKPRDAAPSVVGISQQQLEELAKETDLPPDGASARVGGDFRVTAAAFPSRDDALAMNRRVRSYGYPSEVASRDGAFLVQVGGLADESSARALMAGLRTIPGIQMPVIQPR